MYHKALELIRSEHRTLATLLHAMQYLVREIEQRKAAPKFELFATLVLYLDAVPEKLHHPKEDDYLYRRIRARTHDADALLDRLHAEHAEWARLIRALERALLRYQAEGSAALPEFAGQVYAYADFSLQHMRTEEDQAMPVARRVLTGEDWSDLGQAFGRNGDPLFGPDNTRESDALFRSIVHLAPPPLGLGCTATDR